MTKFIASVEMIKVIAIVLGTTEHNQYCSEHHEKHSMALDGLQETISIERSNPFSR